MDANERGYFEIYNAIVNDPDVTTGFKLIGGGTGFGKTQGISKLINLGANKRKIIYCAHRKQLIENMKKEIGDPARYVILPSNAEAVYNALQIPEPTLEQLVQKEEIFKWTGSDAKKQKTVLQAARRLRKIIEAHKNQAVKHIQDEAVYEANEITGYFRKALKTKAKEEAAKQKNDNTPQNGTRNAKRARANSSDKWLDNPIIWALFPFIEFQRTEKHILLTTVQKGFDSFFDGKSSTNLSRLAGGEGYIVFLDEFDFLEEELLSIICKTPLVDDPFTFVEYFYQEMTRHKLPYEDYATKELQARIQEIILLIDTIRSNHRIEFPTINQFTTHVSEKKARPAIFTTSMTHLNQKLYLRQGRRSFEIYDEEKPRSVNAIDIFRVIYRATQDILILFLELREGNLTQYYEVLQQCYGKTDFHQQVERIYQVARRATEQGYNLSLDSLLDEGYGLYEINRLNYKSDKDEAEFRYYSIFNTPERMLRALAKHNLVFALSATADIPRVVKHFDLNWLERQEGVNIISSSPLEKEIIHALSLKKRKERGSSITVERLPDLDPAVPFHNEIIVLSREAIKFCVQDDKIDDVTLEHRRARVEMFYRVLLWGLTAPTRAENMHLIFVNSFRHIECSLTLPSVTISASRIPETSRSLNIYHVQSFAGHQAIVIFYNAEAARAVNDPGMLKIYNEQFWKGLPVFVVTQYSSAGNGVNLQYLPTAASKEQDKVDFTCLHLLEAPYYFFSGWNDQLSDADNIKALKQDIWYCAKLYMSHLLSKGEFLNILNDLRGAGINRRYRGTSSTRFDLVCNQIAALIQALGRIERVWKPMKPQTLMMSDDVFGIFQAYCTYPEFASVREARDPFLSANLRIVQEQVTEMAQYQEEEAQRHISTQLAKAEKLSIEAVSRLLRRLERLRAGHEDAKARNDWTELRKAMLRHDFDAKIIQRYCGTCATTHYKDGAIWVDENLATYPPNHFPPEAIQWAFNFIYHTVSGNEQIKRYFERNHYPLQFAAQLDRIPTRYFYQAILIGAIGEEAVQALLEPYVELENIDDALFEIADLKISSHAWYIDCKNYGEFTLDTFSLGENDDDMRPPHPKLNSEAFLQAAQKKADLLLAYHQSDDVKLIYLNLYSYKPRRPDYLTLSLERASSFEEARIIILPSILDTDNPDGLHRNFVSLLTDIKNWS